MAKALASRGIPSQIYLPKPLHHQPVYAASPVAAGGVRVAERLPHEVWSLPMHPYLTASDQARITDALRDALR